VSENRLDGRGGIVNHDVEQQTGFGRRRRPVTHALLTSPVVSSNAVAPTPRCSSNTADSIAVVVSGRRRET
jgi:hypothetical protein